jgi:hypothetical protein
MNQVSSIPFTVSNDVIKEYFVPGEEYFDQLLFLKDNSRITILVNRFAPDGNTITTSDTLAYFPARMKYSNFLLVRSEDKQKILLLGFETIADSLPTLHSFLYDNNWTLLNKTVYTNANISQPYVQYDLVDYPLEHFSNTAVKLANSGEWLMTVPSGTNHNFYYFILAGSMTSLFIKRSNYCRRCQRRRSYCPWTTQNRKHRPVSFHECDMRR